MTGSEQSDVEDLFARALVTEDEAYLGAEGRLLERADADALRENLGHADPVGRLLASVLLEWSEAGGEQLERAVAYLDLAERRFASTVAGTPPIRGVVENLSATFGGRAAELLALRLVKASAPAHWRAMATLGYLERHPTPAVTDAVVRFAARTTVPTQQTAAVNLLSRLGDPALAAKVGAERERLARAGRALPTALAALA